MSETPMMKQYLAIKNKHKDAILFFRLGDFYEMFYEDAMLASNILSLTLTGRGKAENRIPMCGIPFHAAENYVSKLVQNGHKVAICEQVEDAGLSKGPTRREVTRIVTPGTAQLESVLDSNASNFLVAICKVNTSFGLAWVDVSTGEFKCDVFDDLVKVQNEILRLDASEVLCDDLVYHHINHHQKNRFFSYDINQAKNYIHTHFKIKSTVVFKIDHLKPAFPAIVAIIDYLNYTQKGAFDQIQTIKPNECHECCVFDNGVIEHLGLFDKKTGLFSFLNQTKTSMGARMLRHWLRYPLIHSDKINERHNKVTFFFNQSHLNLWVSLVENINDIERLLSKICANYNNPKDCLALKESLKNVADILKFLNINPQLFANELNRFDAMNSNHELFQIYQFLDQALMEDVPTHIRDGGIFNPAFNKELNDLCQSFEEIRTWMKTLEPKLRESLDIKSLKVGFNKVFGYYIEIPNSQKDKVPTEFIRKQTLANAERYITPELKEKETIILNAKEAQANLEKKLYVDLITEITKHVQPIQEFAAIIAEIDALQAMASVAITHQLTCPNIVDDFSNELVIRSMWHPVVAKFQTQSFIRNNIVLSKESPFMLITGPNMAGKSTIMRSVALCIIMGQMGGFVPAEMAHFSVVKSIYTRIGASDRLAEGQSTFMVEMVETATICQNATSQSLILLDEIGRGTSTFDGVSIAAAVSEYLVQKTKARVLFATHYHELTALSDKYPQIQNASMQIQHDQNELVFTYQLQAGAIEKSYGVMVAKMAGLPDEIIEKAETWLHQFEAKKEQGDIIQLSLF